MVYYNNVLNIGLVDQQPDVDSVVLNPDGPKDRWINLLMSMSSVTNHDHNHDHDYYHDYHYNHVHVLYRYTFNLISYTTT